jgi:FdhD protein
MINSFLLYASIPSIFLIFSDHILFLMLTNEIKYIHMTTKKIAGASKELNCIKFYLDAPRKIETILSPVEKNISLMVNGDSWVTFMCTPLQLEELGVGFLFNENVITSMDEVASFRVCDNNIIDVWIDHAVKKPEKWSRTSGCTGGKSTVATTTSIEPVESDAKLSATDIINNMKQLLEAQDIYRQSRGVHASALFDGQELRFFSEDIGRHNTFDKLSGQYLISGTRLETPLLLTTGRISSEMIQKAARLKCVFVISLTSPTDQSVEIAQNSGITLIGYARRNSFNVYAHNERISLNESTGKVNSQSSLPDLQQT